MEKKQTKKPPKTFVTVLHISVTQLISIKQLYLKGWKQYEFRFSHIFKLILCPLNRCQSFRISLCFSMRWSILVLWYDFSQLCLNEVGEYIRHKQQILMETEKEPRRKTICYLYQAALHGVKLPLAVMHSKSDWLVCYWDIVHLNVPLLPKWWNYRTLVCESIIAD